MDLRRTLTTLFAWTTLAGGACLMNVLVGFALFVLLPRVRPGLSETAFWQTCALAFSLLGPTWVLAILNAFKGGSTVPRPRPRAERA